MSARIVGGDPQLRGAVTEHSVEQALTRTIAVRATENGPLIPDDAVFLRVARTGPAYAFHFSHDAQSWHFVRLLRVNAAPSTVFVGFRAQAPLGDGATAVFDEITYSRHSLTDLRHLS